MESSKEQRTFPTPPSPPAQTHLHCFSESFQASESLTNYSITSCNTLSTA